MPTRKPTLAQRFAHARAVEGVGIRTWAAKRGLAWRTVYRALSDADEINAQTRAAILESVTRYVADILTKRKNGYKIGAPSSALGSGTPDGAESHGLQEAI